MFAGDAWLFQDKNRPKNPGVYINYTMEQLYPAIGPPIEVDVVATSPDPNRSRAIGRYQLANENLTKKAGISNLSHSVKVCVVSFFVMGFYRFRLIFDLD